MEAQQEHSTSRAGALLLQQVMRECSSMFQHPSPAHVGPITSLSLAPCGQGCTACDALEPSQPCTGAQLACGPCWHMGCTAKMWGTLAHGLHSHGVCLRVRHICMSCMACTWGTLTRGVHCSHVGHARTWGARLTRRARSQVQRTAGAWGRLAHGVHRWHAGGCATP